MQYALIIRYVNFVGLICDEFVSFVVQCDDLLIDFMFNDFIK